MDVLFSWDCILSGALAYLYTYILFSLANLSIIELILLLLVLKQELSTLGNVWAAQFALQLECWRKVTQERCTHDTLFLKLNKGAGRMGNS
jgi:hypothetical protein